MQNPSIQIATHAEAGDKLLGIELLRFASAIAVLVFHYQHFAFIGQQQVDFSRDAQPFYTPLQLFYDYGFYGVQVFWCISGFIFYWKYADEISSHRLGTYSFFVLRLSRLYPLHAATLLFMAVAQLVYFGVHSAYYVYPYNDGYHFVLQLFMASNWGFQAGDSFNGPIWSISIEVLVYALFFVSLRWLSKSPRYLLGMLLAAALVIVLKLSSHPFFYCVMFFYAGCLTAVAHARAQAVASWKKVLTVGAVFVMLCLPSVFYVYPIRPLDFLFLYSPALIFLCVNYFQPRGLGVPLISAAGNITYASYLLHVPVQILVGLVVSGSTLLALWRSPVFFAVYMIGMLALSLLCYTYFEMPAQKYVRRRLLRRS